MTADAPVARGVPRSPLATLTVSVPLIHMVPFSRSISQGTPLTLLGQRCPLCSCSHRLTCVLASQWGVLLCTMPCLGPQVPQTILSPFPAVSSPGSIVPRAGVVFPTSPALRVPLSHSHLHQPSLRQRPHDLPKMVTQQTSAPQDRVQLLSW